MTLKVYFPQQEFPNICISKNGKSPFYNSATIAQIILKATFLELPSEQVQATAYICLPALWSYLIFD